MVASASLSLATSSQITISSMMLDDSDHTILILICGFAVLVVILFVALIFWWVARRRRGTKRVAANESLQMKRNSPQPFVSRCAFGLIQ